MKGEWYNDFFVVCFTVIGIFSLYLGLYECFAEGSLGSKVIPSVVGTIFMLLSVAAFVIRNYQWLDGDIMWWIIPTIIVRMFCFLIGVVIAVAICIEINCLKESSMNTFFISLIAIFSAIVCVSVIYGSISIGDSILSSITRTYDVAEVYQIEPYKTIIVFEYGDELRYIYKNDNYNSYKNSTQIDVSISDMLNSNVVNKEGK